MATLRAWIAFVGIPDDQASVATEAAQIAARRLSTYFKRTLANMAKPAFGDVRVDLNPTSASIASTDLLVHVCLGSLIRSIAQRDNLTVQGGGLGGVVGGATVGFSGGVLSEVYWPWILNHGGSPTERGIMLANQAIHEFAHNKCNGDDSVDPVTEVHANGGGGIFDAQVTAGTLRHGDLSPANAKFLARFIQLAVTQYPFFLFSDDLGF